LLVEDDADDAILFEHVLGEAGHVRELVRLHDGAEAIEYLQATQAGSKAKPRIVFLDLKLPKVDGFQVLG
jgi:two-component system response regulator